MAVIEGHAEHVMDAVAPDLLPSLPKLRAGLDRRRQSQSGLSRLLAKLLGLELKMRQYEQGKYFCDPVVARAGTDGAAARVLRARGAADARRAARSPAWLRRVGLDQRSLSARARSAAPGPRRGRALQRVQVPLVLDAPERVGAAVGRSAAPTRRPAP